MQELRWFAVTFEIHRAHTIWMWYFYTIFGRKGRIKFIMDCKLFCWCFASKQTHTHTCYTHCVFVCFLLFQVVLLLSFTQFSILTFHFHFHLMFMRTNCFIYSQSHAYGISWRCGALLFLLFSDSFSCCTPSHSIQIWLRFWVCVRACMHICMRVWALCVLYVFVDKLFSSLFLLFTMRKHDMHYI